MKFSEHWLREFVNPDIDTDTLAHQLTLAGLEIDGVEPAYPLLSGLVVAEVKSVKKHPDADKLNICKVDCGDAELLSIVCGANNIYPGMHTVLAKVGAKLPGTTALAAVELKGELSNGMLCSEAEIGLGEGSDGIVELSPVEPVGKPIDQIIKLEDKIIEISLTPNRGDCLSINGIAREVAVLNNIDFNEPEIDAVKPASTLTRTVKLSAGDACLAYAGRVIEGVDADIKSPLWLREKLRCSGIRSINAIVDITHFVMLELGQPMHAFDNDRLTGAINVRFSSENEKIKLLDESEHDLQPQTLLIADDSGPLAMAGLMGGYESAVGTGTKNIFLESACFKPETIIGVARRYGLHTDSSHRFERGVAPGLQKTAIDRASRLILALCGGRPGPVIATSGNADLRQNTAITLRKPQIKRILGIDLDDQFISDTLNRLGMEIRYADEQWQVLPPPYRFDIKIEVDLIEELARIHGYAALPVALPAYPLELRAPNRARLITRHIREILVNRDYQEVITYSFVDPELSRLLKNTDSEIVLANPVAPGLSAMRASLWPGLLGTLTYNVKRQRDRIRLFETGLVFTEDTELRQDLHVGGLIYGNRHETHWALQSTLCDFYDLKADIDAVFTTLTGDENYKIRATDIGALHPGQAVEIIHEDKIVGYYGQLHPRILTMLELTNNVFLFEINIKDINFKRKAGYQTISRFPSIRRDIALLIDEKIAYSDVAKCIENSATGLLHNLELFDLYRGEGIEKGKKSLALGLTFQATSSTLRDKDVETIMAQVLDGLHNNFGAKLRE